MIDSDDEAPQTTEPSTDLNDPLILQEPEQNISTSAKDDKQMLSGNSNSQNLPDAVVEPQARSKVPDRDDAFSRPTGFDERFVVTQRRNAQDLYRSYDDKRPAIEDQGDSLKTKNADRATAMDMVELASHRGWSKMNVKGPEEFRREMWIEGTAQGMDVKGYRPSDKDKSEADRRSEMVGYRIIERADGQEKTSTSTQQKSYGNSKTPTDDNIDKGNVLELPNYEKGVSGKISGIGEAPYNDREGASSTPYLSMELHDGRSHKIWGVGLPSMIDDNRLNVGDTATIASAGKKAVSIDKVDLKTGEVQKIDTYRREWTASDIDRAQIKSTPDLSRSEPITKRDEPQSGNSSKERDGSLTKTPDPRSSQDRATELEDRIKSSQAGRDPVVKGAASKLSMMEAELNAQGVDREDVNIAVSNARTQMSKELSGGKKIPVERLANVTRNQEEKAQVIVRAERSRTIERERGDPPERSPSR